MKKDKLHLSARRVDSYNCTFNAIISEREAGKSSLIWTKAYKLFKKKHRTTIVIRRLISDITDVYIQDIEKVVNKFLPKDKRVKLEFKKGSIKDGVVDVYIGNRHFIRVIALSNPMSRIKSTVVENPAMIVFDEFICNVRGGEKWVADESFRYKEIYNTYQRECNGYILKCYFLGNPYSLYNPFFVSWNVPTSALKPGKLYVDRKHSVLVYCYKINERLKEWILQKNPLYLFDDSYTRYAFDGQAVNDANIRIVDKRPDKYYLVMSFRIEGKYLQVWRDGTSETSKYDAGKYWICTTDTCNSMAYAVDFGQLVENSTLWSNKLSAYCYRLVTAIQNRDVTFQTIEASYLTESIYTFIKGR